MSRRPLVSILMNSRNAPRYLVPAVRSVLWQSYPRLELIVSEASDDDEGVGILEAFADPRLTIVRDTDRIGWARGINLAAERARGDYILFCAGDDLFHPLAVERMVAQLMTATSATVVLPVRAIDERGVPTGRTIVVPAFVRDEPTWVRLFERNYIVVAMTRREVLPTPLIDESLRGVGADWDLWLRLVRQGSGFTYLDETLFDYRVHGDSLVATEGNARADMRAVLCRIGREAIADAYRRSGLDRDVVAEGLANVAITLGDHGAALAYWKARAERDGLPESTAQAGALLLTIGSLAAAEGMLRVAAVPGHLPEAWNNLGVVLARQGRLDAARPCFEEALRQFPMYRDARENLASRTPSLVTERLLRPIAHIVR